MAPRPQSCADRGRCFCPQRCIAVFVTVLNPDNGYFYFEKQSLKARNRQARISGHTARESRTRMVRMLSGWLMSEIDRYCSLLRKSIKKVPRTDENISLLKTLYRAVHGKPFPAVKQRLWSAIEVRFYSKLVVSVKKLPKTAATMRALRALCTKEMRQLPGYRLLGVPRKYTRRGIGARTRPG